MLTTVSAPLSPGIQYTVETLPSDYWQEGLYMGEPCNESEHAWNQLIHRKKLLHSTLNRNANSTPKANRQHGIKLYRDEALRLDITESILLPDDNFAVILSVHHNLHCLVRTPPRNLWIPFLKSK